MRLATPDATIDLGRRIGRNLILGDIVALSGPLGAGKTELARGMLQGAGYAGDIASPSFPIVIAYDPPTVTLPILHVDLYRIDHPSELDELGLDEARTYGALIIEWPERLGQRAWPEMLVLSLATDVDDARALTAQVPPAWEARWPTT